MRHAAAAFLVLAALAAPARTDGTAEPTYADKPASWWVEELVAGDNPDAARSVLSRMGEAAAGPIAARLPSTRSVKDRRALLVLLSAMRAVPASVAPHLRASLRSDDGAEQRDALKVAGRLPSGTSGIADDVATLLSSSLPDVRAAAAAALGTMGHAAAPHVGALVARIEDDDQRVVLAAVTALGTIGPRAAAALPALLAFAAARPPQAAHLRALVAIGPDDDGVADALVRAADSADERTCDAVTDVLSRATANGGAVHAAAIRLARHASPRFRRAAAGALGRWGAQSGQYADELYALLEDPDAGVVGAATEALTPRPPGASPSAQRVVAAWRRSKVPIAFVRLLPALGPEIGPALFDCAVSDDEALRNAAWHVIQRSSEGTLAAEADRLTRALLDERIDAERRFALLSLVVSHGALRGDAMSSVLAAVVREGDAKSAALAAATLRAGPARRDALLAAAVRPEPAVRAAAIGVLAGELSSDASVRDAIVRALDDADATVRATAIRVLATHHGAAWETDSEARGSLVAHLPALASAGPEARRDVLSIVRALPSAARPLPLLVSMLAFDDCVEPVTSTLGALGASILQSRTDPDPSEFLTPLLDGADAVLAARAARVLVMRRTGAGVVERLPPWVESPDPRVARAAVLAANELTNADIARIGGPLVRAARGGVEGVAWPACSALSRVAADEPVARDALLAVADDPANSAQVAVVPFLVALGTPGLERIVRFLEHPSRDARLNACVTLLPIARRDGGNREALASATPALDRLAASDDLEMARLAKDVLTAIRR